jgi:2-methylisocitrate lyase-like PEP mutase family enzyme
LPGVECGDGGWPVDHRHQSAAGQPIARATALPTLADADNGFGDPVNAALTVGLLEDTGVAGLHIEDLTSPPRPRHTGSKNVIVLAAGLSTAEAKAASSHTGAPAQQPFVVRQLFTRAGALLGNFLR